MKTNQSTSRGENARNEERDSQGRFESNDRKSKTTGTANSSKKTMDHKSKTEAKDSHGKVESSHKSKK